MSNVSRLKEVADETFRKAAIEILIEGDKDIQSTLKDIPPVTDFDLDSLLDTLSTTTETSTYLKPLFDENGKLCQLEETARNIEEMGGANCSMSLNRVPFLGTTSIKGSSSNVPFFPGGLDDGLAFILSSIEDTKINDGDEERLIDMKVLLDCPPGYREAVSFPLAPGSETQPSVETTNTPPPINLDTADIFDLLDFIGSGESIVIPEKQTVEVTKGEEESVHKQEDAETTDELESVLSTPLVVSNSTPYSSLTNKYDYAKLLDTSADIPEYAELFPRMAKKYPFTLDPFQQASVVCMENGESVFVAAHTSAGKTVVAEYAISLCQAHKTRAIYTSPIKALSNQKFRDFKMVFDEVGLVTGDIQLHPEAFCLIMTTEILRSKLYNGSEVIRELEWVVFDEVHYINDAERGHVWEEVLIMLPSHVKIVMLSATVPNCLEFADWVGRIKNRRINVVSTYRRPVPLEHFLYTGQDGKTRDDMFLVIDKQGEYDKWQYKKAQEVKQNLRKPTTGAKGKGGGGFTRNDKNVYINLVEHLRKREQLPMVCFVFSRKRCDENAQLLLSLDLTTAVEKSHVKTFFGQCIQRLKGTDKVLPQVLTLRELCIKGIGVHHSGILPILKEVVELLFQKGYVKILFATETFAMGVNMPARTVVFDSIQKHDGTSLRPLTPGEYIQMAGRAGRRGLDSTGKVIVLCKGPHLPEVQELQSVMMGNAMPLESRFRVTYSMLLNLLRVEQLRIEDMLQRSYVENVSLREAISRKENLEKAKTLLSSHPLPECPTCYPNEKEQGIEDYLSHLDYYLHERSVVFPRLSSLPSIDKLLDSGRVLVVTHAAGQLAAQLCILVKMIMDNGVKRLKLLVPCEAEDAHKNYEEEYAKKEEVDRIWEQRRLFLESSSLYGIEGIAPSHITNRSFRFVDNVPLESVVSLTHHSIKIDAAVVFNQAERRKIARFRDEPPSNDMNRILVELDTVRQKMKRNDMVVLQKDIQVTDMNLFPVVSQLNHMRQSLLNSTNKAPHCVHFKEHLLCALSRRHIVETVSRLEHALSADSLLLSEEYHNRLSMLKALNYVDSNNMVTFKGRVACEIHHQELLVTELILDGKLHDRSAAEVAGLLSATTCQFKAPQECKFAEGSVFAQLQDDVLKVSNRIAEVALEKRIKLVEVGDDLRFDLLEMVHMWAKGESFASIMQTTECQEGLIVRCIQRLGEVCKDVRNAARIVGDPQLYEKMEQVSAAIKRDIVFAASLYTSV